MRRSPPSVAVNASSSATLDKPRHVEAQVIVISTATSWWPGTRDCSLQRRFQKLVEEAPAPFLADAQRKRSTSPRSASASPPTITVPGTVEYLVGQDGRISFLG